MLYITTKNISILYLKDKKKKNTQQSYRSKFPLSAFRHTVVLETALMPRVRRFLAKDIGLRYHDF